MQILYWYTVLLIKDMICKYYKIILYVRVKDIICVIEY